MRAPRHAAAGQALRVLGFGALALAAWGVLVEPRLLRVHHELGRVPGLPRAWHGQRLALFADIQVGIPLSNVDTVRRLVQRVLQERPALVLIAGDFIYDAARDPAAAVERAVQLVAPLTRAGLSVYAVLGNHDYAEELTDVPAERRAIMELLRDRLEQTGIHVLHNAATALPAPGAEANHPSERPLYLVGVGDPRLKDDRPLQAIQQVPAEAPRIVCMHNPRAFAPLPPGSAPFALAGHTHGGQIRVPGLPRLTLARLLKDFPNYLDGWIDGYGAPGNHLYVTRGVGFSVVPVRIGCPPQLTLFTLQPA